MTNLMVVATQERQSEAFLADLCHELGEVHGERFVRTARPLRDFVPQRPSVGERGAEMKDCGPTLFLSVRAEQAM